MKLIIATLLSIISATSYAAYPVIAVPAQEQARLLESDSATLAANKRVAYDIYRYVMAGQLDKLDELVSKDLINHNPNEASGFDGMKNYLRQIVGSEPRPLKDTLDGLVSISAEGDMVIISMLREFEDPNVPGKKYTTTWFDMFRIVDGLMVEHWDPAKLKAN
ncbi:MAG: hypothetical protein GKR93_18590 [Gammaproteobacteria bacterium]|nr:hypothetical protein [Gammaproteobacteria bacterium]